jgi:hypothetical protein
MPIRSDTARIDWLISRLREPDLESDVGYWIGGDGQTKLSHSGASTIYSGATLREAIDKVIDAERQEAHSQNNSKEKT